MYRAPARAGDSWLRTRRGWIGYAAGWLTFATGFGAVFWFGRPDLARAARASATVVLPAAVLGIGVVALCGRLPLRMGRRWWLPFAHGAFALGFAALWIGGVCLAGYLLTAAAGGTFNGLAPPHILHWHLLAGTLLYAVLASVTLGYRHTVNAVRERLATELRVLQAPLTPHFMLNAMHSILAIGRRDAEAGEGALSTFTQMLRYVHTLQRDAPARVPFESEWTFVEHYLDVERLRLGDRLRVVTAIDEDAFDVAVPPLVLQPLVENAIIHGVAPRTDGGAIHISAAVQGAWLTLVVANDAESTSPLAPTAGSRTGLASMRARLDAFYGTRAQMNVDAQPRAFTVTVRLPADGGDERHPA